MRQARAQFMREHAIWFECTLRPGARFLLGDFRVPNALVGWLVTGPMTVFLIWFVIWFNRRVRTSEDETPMVPGGPRVMMTGSEIAAR